MSDGMKYQFLNHQNAPKRVLSLTLDELVVAVIGFGMLAVSSQKIAVALLSLSLLSALRYLKKGAGPKALLVLAYWYLPSQFTQFFLPKLPHSHQRVWVA